MPLSQIKQHERRSIIKALRAGVVPKQGLRHIQVGRAREIEELIRDIEHIGEGGATIRFIIGEYGSGKTFFLNLIRLIAHEKNMVVLSADMAPDRRLHGTGGRARALYAEMTRNISTRAKPGGGAMASVVERFINTAVREAAKKDDLEPDEVICAKLAHLEELAGGYDFATVIARYWEGAETGDEDLKSAALQWLRAEYTTRTGARKELKIRTIIDDANIYDHLKLLALFVREAGYKGLVVSLDELVTLYRLTSQARKSNYEQILRILNDVLQGTASHLGFILGGTPEFLTDTHRGLYSDDALRSRLAENPFAQDGLVDTSGPVIQLANLTPEDMFVLLSNIRRVMQGENATLPNDALEAFMKHCSNRIGDAYFRTPRNTITAFVNMLSVLEQNPGADWHTLLGSVGIAKDGGDDMSDIQDEEKGDELASFKL